MVLNHTVIYRTLVRNSRANNSHTSTVILGLLGHISLSEICQIGPLPAQLMSDFQCLYRWSPFPIGRIWDERHCIQVSP